MFAAFARLDWRDFSPFSASREPLRPGLCDLGLGFSGRALFGAAGPSPELPKQLDPICAVALGGKVAVLEPHSGLVRAARAAEARTGRRVAIPTVVSGHRALPEALARRDWVGIGLDDPTALLALFHVEPKLEVLPEGFVVFDAPPAPAPKGRT